jgi:hypothetical protein
MKRNPPHETWLRIAAEARAHTPPAASGEPAPDWFVTRAIAQRRAARAARSGDGLLTFPFLGRTAAVSVALALACAVFVASTASFDDLDSPFFPEPDELSLP